MKLTLIKPNIGFTDKGRYVDSGRMEPLNIGVLALPITHIMPRITNH